MKKQLSLKPSFAVLLGFIIWVLAILNQVPYSFFDLTHVQALLIAAPLWLIPLAWSIAKKPAWVIWLAVCCGILFTIAYQTPQGISSGLMLLPWFGLSIFFAIQHLLFFKTQSLRESFSKLAKLSETAGYIYLPVGVFWAIIDRLGVQILGYDPTIILLTAVHFHYAGFILPQVTSWLLEKENALIYKLLNIGIILGIPLVAVGISATHFNWPGWVEVLSVTIMTVAGMGIAMLLLRLGTRTISWLPKACFFIGGLALFIGMALAFCYGWRHVFIIETLTIPWMYAVHGTCNAIGFAAPVLLGWHLKQTS